MGGMRPSSTQPAPHYPRPSGFGFEEQKLDLNLYTRTLIFKIATWFDFLSHRTNSNILAFVFVSSWY